METGALTKLRKFVETDILTKLWKFVETDILANLRRFTFSVTRQGKYFEKFEVTSILTR